MNQPLVEVEYVRGGKRKLMRKIYADTLTKLGVTRIVEANVAESTDEPKRKRTYRRRDMQAEGTEP